MNRNPVKPNSFEDKIYRMCDGLHTTSDIAKKVGKSIEYTGSVLSRLKQKGLIKTLEKNGKKFHLSDIKK